MKKMKKVSSKIAKIFLLIAIIISDLASPIKVFADTLSNETLPSVGSIRLNDEISETGSVTVTEGSLDNEGDVQVTKTVTTLNAAEGKYNVTFKIQGKDKTKTTTTPIYAVVVFDKSGSMKNYTDEVCTEYRVDMLGIKHCKNWERVEVKKWDSAVSGAKDFASSLNKSLNSGETKYANIALVQFSGSKERRDTAWNDATIVREFDTTDFSDVNFGSANGGTNLGEGLNKALGLFTDKSNPIPEKAKKYVVVIGDGRPTFYSDSEGMTQGTGNSDPEGKSAEYATDKADALKKIGVEIFTIGYDIEDNTDAQDVLKKIASSDVEGSDIKHSVLAGEADIAETFTTLANSISTTNAGTNASVIDNIGSSFKIVGKDGNTITSDVVSTITKEETTIMSFDIQIDPDSATGWHKTNEGFELVYTDSNNNEQRISSNEDPEVYWVQKEYDYVVNYYKDEITNKNDSNYLGSESYKAVKDTEITENNVDKTLFIPEGYEFNKVEFGNNDETSIIVTNNGTHNEINVLYTIKKFNYRVEYYKDNSLFDSKNISNVPYNTNVDSSTYYLSEENIPTGYILDTDKSDNNSYTITNNDVVIKIYYKKNRYAYTVNYYFNDVYDNTFTKNNEALYGDKLFARDFNLTSEELINNGKGDYFLNPNRPYNPEEITIDVNGNVINVYYVNTYLVDNSENITKTANTTNNKITSSNQVVNYEVNYEAKIKNVNKGSVVETKIIDTLPYEIDLTKSNLTYNGLTGIYDKDSKTITWTITTTVDKYYEEYNVNKTIKYSVVYMNFEEVSSNENNTLVNTVKGITSVNANNLSDGVTDEASVLVEVKGKLIVKYLEKDTNKVLLNDKVTTDKVGTNYTTNAENIFGYTFDSVNGNENGKYSVTDTTVIYYYTKNAGETTEPTIVKEGPNKVSSINDKFNYTLNGSVTVLDYIGKATLKVVDTLPYKIDTNKSVIDKMCSYDGNYTITCTKEYNITENDYVDGQYEINESFALELVFIDINSDKVINKAKSIVDLDGNTIPSKETEKETEVEKGSLKVIYKTTDNVVLKELPETTELAGTKYSTVKESFYGYTFKENQGASVSGEYVANNTLVVYYIYTKNDGEATLNKVTKTQNNQIIDINSEYNYVLSYNGKIENYVGEATLELIDTLPYNATIVSMDNRCSINGKTITCTDTYNITENNNIINANFDIKLRYTNVLSEVINKVQSKLTYGTNSVTDNAEVKDIVPNGTVIATYKTEDGQELNENISNNGLAGEEYTTNELSFYGYTLKDVTGAGKTGKYVGNETLYVNYIYTKNIGGSEDDLIKEGSYEVEGINSEFKYNIKYNAVINDYVGEVTITIIDKLPYKLDLSKSEFNKNVWTYNEEDLTLTYTNKYNVKEKFVIDFNEELSLYYIGVDSNEVYNGVISNLTYGEVSKDNENGVYTKVNEGNVLVKYVTVKDNNYVNLTDDITLNGLVGTTYTTSEKEFDNYVLVETIGETEGEFTLEDKEVIYVYKLKELPPKTGVMVESNNTNILSLLLVAVIGLLIRKMR